jgi:hypothetical protein
MNIIKCASDLDIRTPDADVVRAISILLNRFSFEFTPEQRNAIVTIVKENQ